MLCCCSGATQTTRSSAAQQRLIICTNTPDARAYSIHIQAQIPRSYSTHKSTHTQHTQHVLHAVSYDSFTACARVEQARAIYMLRTHSCVCVCVAFDRHPVATHKWMAGRLCVCACVVCVSASGDAALVLAATLRTHGPHTRTYAVLHPAGCHIIARTAMKPAANARRAHAFAHRVRTLLELISQLNRELRARCTSDREREREREECVGNRLGKFMRLRDGRA